jgi:hypothetical protein
VSEETLPELSDLTTEELRDRAFAVARHRADIGFFWDLIRHLPHADDAESVDGSTGSFGETIDDTIALWRELAGHEYGQQEPVIRAKFIDYLSRHAR